MLTQTFRKWSELSGVEKANISTRMLLAQSPEEKDSVRESLCQQYWIGVSSVGALVAHETMRRKKNLEWVRWDSQEWEQSIVLIDTEQVKSSHTQTVQKATQARIYKITTLSELTEEMRDDILEEFWDVIKNNTEDSVYDYYQDIEVLSEYYNIEPSILKQFLKNRYNWLWTKLDELKKWKILIEEDKLSIRLYVEAWSDEKDKKVRRKEMAKQYRVSTFVIWAITAWKVDKSGWVILKKDGIWNEEHLITETLNGKSSTSMVEVTTQTGKNPVIDLKEEQSLSDEDQAFIWELAWDFDLSNDAKRELFLQDVFDLFPDATIEDIKMIVSNFPDDTTHANIKRSGEGMWALVNYNNAIKNKWREKLKEFITTLRKPHAF